MMFKGLAPLIGLKQFMNLLFVILMSLISLEDPITKITKETKRNYGVTVETSLTGCRCQNDNNK